VSSHHPIPDGWNRKEGKRCPTRKTKRNLENRNQKKKHQRNRNQNRNRPRFKSVFEKRAGSGALFWL